MNPFIRAGLIAGAIGGEAMIILVLVNTILLRNFSAGPRTDPALVAVWGIAYPLIVILVFEGGGIFSSWICRFHPGTQKDALITGAIAGVTIGIILEIMWMANIVSLASRSVRIGSGTVLGNGDPAFIAFLLVILVLMGSVLSAFGSWLYSTHLFRNNRDDALPP